AVSKLSESLDTGPSGPTRDTRNYKSEPPRVAAVGGASRGSFLSDRVLRQPLVPAPYNSEEGRATHGRGKLADVIDTRRCRFAPCSAAAAVGQRRPRHRIAGSRPADRESVFRAVEGWPPMAAARAPFRAPRSAACLVCWRSSAPRSS